MNKDEIISWLNEYDIKGFSIEEKNNQYIVNVNTSVYLRRAGLKSFPFKFGYINGFFDCSHNELDSLKNGPSEVKKSFSCIYNRLIDLKYGPKIIGEDFSCSNNLITTLSYSPQIIKNNFYFTHNPIQDINIDDLPKAIEKNLIFSNNRNFNDCFRGYENKDGIIAIGLDTMKKILLKEKLSNIMVNDKKSNFHKI